MALKLQFVELRLNGVVSLKVFAPTLFPYHISLLKNQFVNLFLKQFQ